MRHSYTPPYRRLCALAVAADRERDDTVEQQRLERAGRVDACADWCNHRGERTSEHPVLRSPLSPACCHVHHHRTRSTRTSEEHEDTAERIEEAHEQELALRERGHRGCDPVGVLEFPVER